VLRGHPGVQHKRGGVSRHHPEENKHYGENYHQGYNYLDNSFYDILIHTHLDLPPPFLGFLVLLAREKNKEKEI
jgi:hypothetical protein